MKRFATFAVGLFLAAVAAVFVLGYMKPQTWSAEHSVRAKASRAQVATDVLDFQRWPDWTVWNKTKDPEATWTYTGTPGQPGASMTWTGPVLGDGRMVLDEVSETRVVMSLFFGGEAAPNRVLFTFLEKAGHTMVTWRVEGDLGQNPIARLFGGTISRAVKKDIRANLASLLARSEARAAAPAVQAPALAVPAAASKPKADRDAPDMPQPGFDMAHKDLTNTP